MPKSKESKVKIISPHRWPSLFLTIGVYDVMHDLIFIKGGLPKITFHQTLKHEKAHRKWFSQHPGTRKFYNFLYWPPTAFYFILFAFFIGLYFLSISFSGLYMVLLSTLLCLFTLCFHLGLTDVLERPAKKAAGSRIVGLSNKELWHLRIVALIPIFLLLPTIFTRLILSIGSTLIVLGLGFFGIWLYQVLQIPVINNLRKK